MSKTEVDHVFCVFNAGETTTNYLFGNSLYIYITYLIMVIWGMLYSCFTHIIHSFSLAI